ncbi:hypothetical protein WDW89_02035 [Deltaproteobacteria bacterium TL4]
MSSEVSKAYKSPRGVLLDIFRKGRDEWKAKCLEAKAQLKYQKQRVRFLELSKSRLKSEVQELKEEVRYVKAQLRREEREDSESGDIEGFKKNSKSKCYDRRLI